MKTQGRKYRILIGSLAPPSLGVVILYIFLMSASRSADDAIFATGILFLGIPLSFFAVGGQAAVCSLLMEYVINPNTSKHWQAVSAAGLLGAISGVFFGWVFSIFGIIVGMLSGWHLRCHYEMSNKALNSQASPAGTPKIGAH